MKCDLEGRRTNEITCHFCFIQNHIVPSRLLMPKSRFDPRAVDVGFVVDKVASGQDSIRALRVSRVSGIPSVLHNDIYSSNIDAI